MSNVATKILPSAIAGVDESKRTPSWVLVHLVAPESASNAYMSPDVSPTYRMPFDTVGAMTIAPFRRACQMTVPEKASRPTRSPLPSPLNTIPALYAGP